MPKKVEVAISPVLFYLLLTWKQWLNCGFYLLEEKSVIRLWDFESNFHNALLFLFILVVLFVWGSIFFS